MLSTWAEHEFKHKLSQSTISESLSTRYAFLDTGKATNFKKSRQAAFPILETALKETLLRLNNKGMPLTGDIIISIAKQLWVKIDQFKDQPMPSFSKGWLDGFKSRHQFRRYRQHGEAKSAEALDYSQQLQELQKLCLEYDSNDIYNADETGLFWQATPSYTLATGPQAGCKQKKDRITILPCCNASGTHRLQLWIIGKAANPRAFGKNNSQISMHPIHYRSNKKAWMTGKLFFDWLQWFDGQMTGRKVLLLLDNFSAHERGYIDAMEQHTLRHTRVAWLPPNSTSLLQPMDQGIINNLKVYYKRYWLEFAAHLALQDRDPLREVTLLRAIGWIIEAWTNGVKSLTVNNCWIKSQLFGSRVGPIPRPADWDESREALRELLLQAQSDQADLDNAALDQLINPDEEQIIETDEDIIDQVADSFSVNQDDDDNLDRLLPPFISIAEGSDALEKLINFEEQREDPDYNFLQTLYQHQRRLLFNWRLAREKAKTQQSIEQYLVTALGSN